MQSLNKVYLLGHLGSDPELRASTRGKHYLHLNLATHRRWKKEDEGWEERTDWHSVTVWGRDAEFCEKNLRKGQAVFVEGYLSPYTVKLEGEEGSSQRHMLAVTADRVRFWPLREALTPQNLAQA